MPVEGTSVPSRTLREHFQDIQDAYGSRDVQWAVQLLGLKTAMDAPLHEFSAPETGAIEAK